MNPNGNGGLFRGLIEEGMVREPGRSRSPDRWAPAAGWGSWGRHGETQLSYMENIWILYG